eukprot:12960701-Ditylum_brightwellii.AAC.1
MANQYDQDIIYDPTPAPSAPTPFAPVEEFNVQYDSVTSIDQGPPVEELHAEQIRQLQDEGFTT